MNFYNPQSGQIFGWGQMRLTYNIKTPQEANQLGYYELIDRIDDYFDLEEYVKPGQIFKSEDKYVRVVELTEQFILQVKQLKDASQKLNNVVDFLKTTLPSWDASTTYNRGTFVLYNDVVYVSKQQTTNVSPELDDIENVEWSEVFR